MMTLGVYGFVIGFFAVQLSLDWIAEKYEHKRKQRKSKSIEPSLERLRWSLAFFGGGVTVV